MNNWWIIPVALLCIILALQRKETNQYIESRIRKQKGDVEMQKLAQRYIGKDVLLNNVNNLSGNSR